MSKGDCPLLEKVTVPFWLLRKSGLDRVEHQACNIQVELLVEFPDARGAGDVDLGQVVADDVDTGEQDARVTQSRADLLADFDVAFRQFLPFRDRPGDQIAAIVVASRNARQRVGDGLRRRSAGCVCPRA